MKVSIFSLIIAIAVAILSLFQFERYQSLERSTENHIQNLNNQIQPQIQALQKEYSQIVQSEATKIEHQPDTIWVESQIEYLINLANFKLQLQNDVNGAVQLLTLSETLLGTVDEIKFNPLKEALATDKTQLQAIKEPDINTLWNKITNLITTVPDLPTRGIRSTNTIQNADNTSQVDKADLPSPTPASVTTDNNWKQSLQNSWQEMKQLVKIRHHTKPIEPILTENEAQLAKENLRLLLSQLRLAVLQKEDNIYKSLIEESKTWLEHYFENSNTKVIDAQKTLSEMETITLKPSLPTLQHSLTELKNLRK